MRQFYDELLVIKRLKQTSGVKRGYVATATADASVQALGKDRGNIQEGVFGKTFVAYMDFSISIEVGDQVRDRNGNVYQVTDVVSRDFGAFPHKEVIMKKA